MAVSRISGWGVIIGGRPGFVADRGFGEGRDNPLLYRGGGVGILELKMGGEGLCGLLRG